MIELNLAFLLSGGSESTRVLLDMALIFVSAKVLAEIAERLGQPPLAGEIAAGILLGPSVLHWVEPSQVLSVLAHLGVMFLLFRVGLEIRDFRLGKVGIHAMAVACAGVAIPFLGGWGLLSLLGHSRLDSVFAGVALSVSSVGVTARVLGSMGLINHVVSKTILTAAIVDSVAGLFGLGVASSLSSGSLKPVEFLSTASLGIAFIAIVALWGDKTVGRIMPQLPSRLRAAEHQFALAILLVFVLSLLATFAGVAAILGCFLAGMAVSRSIDRRAVEMTTGISELFVPFFLVGIGLHLDLAILMEANTLLLSAALTLTACATKFAGGSLGGFGLGWKNAYSIGTGMMPRGEAGMVVAHAGLGLTALAPAVYGAVVLMTIFTTVIAHPLLRWVLRDAEGAAANRETLPRVG